MADAKLKAEQRTEFGKGAARRIRRAGRVPAVIYGHGTDPIHVSLPGHETMLALRTANALLQIDVDGDTKLALVKQVQRDPISTNLEHVDLVLIRRGEKVTVDVALIVTGEAAPDTLVVTDTQTISLEVPATDIPEQVEVSVEGLEVGAQIVAKDLNLPANATYTGEEDDLMVSVNAATVADLGDSDAAEGAEDAGGATSEGEEAAE